MNTKEIAAEETAARALRPYVVEIGSLHDIFLSIRSGKPIPDYVKNRHRNCQTYTAYICMTMLAIPLSIMTDYVACNTDDVQHKNYDENYDSIITHINRYNSLFKELSKIIVRIYGTVLEDHISSIDDGKILLALLNVTIHTIMEDDPLIIHPYEPERKVLVDDFDSFPNLPKTNPLELPKSPSKNTWYEKSKQQVMMPPASKSYSKTVVQRPGINITDSNEFPPLSTSTYRPSKRR
jgi:hypothetical protein